MSIGLVDDARRMVAQRARHGAVSVATFVTIALGAACSSGSLLEPGDASLVTNRDGVATSASGLEQRLTTRVEAATPGSPYTAELVATSVITNTSSAKQNVTARVCLFLDGDVQTTAQMNRYEPFISCAAVSAASELAPGQSTAPMEVRFGVLSGPGNYTLKLRHALSPELRAEASFRIP